MAVCLEVVSGTDVYLMWSPSTMNDAEVASDLGKSLAAMGTSHLRSMHSEAKVVAGCQADKAAQVHNGPRTSQATMGRYW